MVIYTKNLAADIVDIFEDALDQFDVTLPSPEDDQREPDNAARLYGTTYWKLLNEVEDYISTLLRDIDASGHEKIDVRYDVFE